MIKKFLKNLSLSEKQEFLSLLQSKNIMTTGEAAFYLGVSVPTLRNLRRNKKIASYQPNGGKVYYKREDLDDWQLNSKQSDSSTIENRVSSYFLNSKF